MEKRIELEKRGRAPAQIKELNLDNCKSTTIMGLTNEYTTLGNLSLINVGLTSLRGFPKLPNLEKLELSDNRISSGLNVLINSPKLTYLSLSGNRIKDLETLAPLKELKCLKNLELFNCDVSTTEGYREKVYELIPNLEYLDGYDKDDIAFGESSIDEDCAEEEDENNFYKDEESEGESEVSEEDEPDVNDDEDEEDDEYLRRDLEDEGEKENDYSSENEEGEGDDDDDDDLDDDDEEEENETLNGFKGTKRKHSDSEDE